eukprot:Skav233448  [mRNA]  locus=scaffold1486:385221:387670:- [translate_table: standard]
MSSASRAVPSAGPVWSLLILALLAAMSRNRNSGGVLLNWAVLKTGDAQRWPRRSVLAGRSPVIWSNFPDASNLGSSVGQLPSSERPRTLRQLAQSQPDHGAMAVDATELLRALVERRGQVNLVQIGACDGDFGSSNDPVQGFLMEEPQVAALLVEASPRTHATLRRKEFEDYVEEIMVACKTPAKLLEDAQIRPNEVDVLAIDAEGLDEEILKLFLRLWWGLPDFDPSIIFCEVTHVDPAALQHLSAELQQLQYQLGRAESEMTEDGLGDLVAWK